MTATSATSAAAIAQVTDRAAVAQVTVTPPVTIEPTAPPSTPEPQLAVPVREALAGDPDLELLKISVQQAGTTIQLSGEVPNQDLKAAAEALAKGVPGVGAVDSTGLLVIPPDLAKQALEKLRSDPRTQGLALSVELVGNSLRLSGSVPSAEARNQIISLARTIEGVDLVDAEALSVAGSDLAMKVQEALKKDGALASLALRVRQVGAGIILQGSVPDVDLKLQAEALARHVAGVELVDVGQIEVKPVAVEYVVERGDSLVSIARRFYLDGAKWPVIFAANRAIIDRPALIRVGMRLVIPPLP